MTEQNGGDLYLSSAWMSDLLTPGRGRAGDLSDVGRLHRFVMGLFGPIASEEQPRQAAGILFRTEQVGRRPRLIVQSSIEPKPDPRLSVKDASILLDAMQDRTPVRLRITVNPVLRDSKTKADKPITGAEVLANWIEAKLSRGFGPLDVIDLRTGTLRCGKLRIATATIDAQTWVMDRAQCVELIRSGVGRRKSHGCGLLSVAPIRV